jgi:phosphopantothenoylcysteine decarboxylase/phosphopantothenate--cysteine ligase
MSIASLTNKNILLGVSGSIAAYKAPDIVRRLQDFGAEVRVILTRRCRG